MSGGLVPQSMTYAQVAALVGRSVSTIEKWVKHNLIPFHRVGRSVRFDPVVIKRWMEENDLDADNRIHGGPRGGAQYVFPHETLGDEEHCWCGDLVDHEWEGKGRGAPHPHNHEGIQQVVVVEQNNPVPEWRHIDKGALRGFHAALKGFLTQCVNTDRLPWRPINNGVLVYPPDDTNAVAVYCRNNDGQLRALQTWYAAHVEPYQEATREAVQRLAEAVNDPEEHPPLVAVPGEDEWHPYMHSDGAVSDIWESDGNIVRCGLCIGKSTAYETPVDKVTGLGGHVRMTHRDTENLRTPEALARSVDSRRYNALHSKVLAAVELLAETVGYTGTNRDLEAENTRLKAALEAQRQRADDAVARLQLMKEAMRGLEDG